MGQICSSASDNSQSIINSKIEVEIKKSKKEEKDRIKVLLLGTLPMNLK